MTNKLGRTPPRLSNRAMPMRHPVSGVPHLKAAPEGRPWRYDGLLEVLHGAVLKAVDAPGAIMRDGRYSAAGKQEQVTKIVRGVLASPLAQVRAVVGDLPNWFKSTKSVLDQKAAATDARGLASERETRDVLAAMTPAERSLAIFDGLKTGDLEFARAIAFAPAVRRSLITDEQRERARRALWFEAAPELTLELERTEEMLPHLVDVIATVERYERALIAMTEQEYEEELKARRASQDAKVAARMMTTGMQQEEAALELRLRLRQAERAAADAERATGGGAPSAPRDPAIQRLIAETHAKLDADGVEGADVPSSAA